MDTLAETYPKHAHVLGRHKVDRDTLATKTTTATNPVNVIFTVGREIITGYQIEKCHISKQSFNNLIKYRSLIDTRIYAIMLT